MLVFRHTPKKCRKKGFANHFVLLLQFHESRNAAERGRQKGRKERLWGALVGPDSTVTYFNGKGLDGIV